MITQKYLKECLDYNQLTGVFTWKERPLHHFKNNQARSAFNTKLAGKGAGVKATNNKGKDYIRIKISQKAYYAHRLAFLYMAGEMPEHEADHIDGDSINNKWINLRPVTHKDNCRNTRPSKSSKSGVAGVNPLGSKWRARIKIDGKEIGLGLFKDKNLAITARIEANKHYGFHENHGMPRI